MLKFHFDFITFLLIAFNSGVVAQTTPELILPEDLHGTVQLNISFTADQNKISDYDKLAVFVKNETDKYLSNAIQGNYTKDGEYLIFKPYFPFERGMTYVVRTIKEKSDDNYSYRPFQIGNKGIAEEAKVISIYPTANQLPENLLRFYIYFNTPMKKGQALKHIKLIDEQGKIDNHVFMEFKQELWSADGKRLTLSFDPGRIKRGVSTNMLRGPALIEGKHYKLSISGTWQDVHGQQLTIDSIKEFVVDNGYRQHIKTNDWFIDVPKANTNDSLTLKFDRIIDHALIQSMIKLENGENNYLAGHWEILENEQLIRFIPEKKWKKGNYRIIIDGRLEDIAGNNLQNLLDHNKTDDENNSETHQYIKFKI